MNFAAAAPLSLGLKRPLAYCAHDPAPHPGDYAPGWQRATQRLLLRRADTVAALSDYAAGQFAHDSRIAAKLRVARLASVFEPIAAAAPLQGQPVRLLMFGRMIAYKGLDLVDGVLERLAGRQDWRLTIAGHGPALDSAAQSRLSSLAQVNVRAGWLEENDIAQLIDAHDVVLAPYREASQSGVVAQAMARGRPVVATPVGALPEQMDGGRAGWLADAVSVDAFAAALERALDDAAERKAKSAAALVWARAAWAAPEWDWLGEGR
jgi:glycosyltransferase involved in cell wall biosynthesis